MIVFKGEDFATVYHDSLKYLMDEGPKNDPRGTKTKELLNVALVMENPASCLYENEVRSSQRKYIAGELLWYFSGRNDVKFISKFSKFWENLQNPDGTANSAYGHLIFKNENIYGFTQYQWVIESLTKDSNTRQAVMHFNLPSHQYSENRDFVCTMYANFHIRNNKLFMKVNMRSNDVITGTPTDIAFFSTVQLQVFNTLKKVYPDLQLGSYTHVADSYHVYDRHYDLVDRMLAKPFYPVIIPLINNDLIADNKGTPSDDIIALVEYVENDSNDTIICQQDDLLKWIVTNLSFKRSSENRAVESV